MAGLALPLGTGSARERLAAAAAGEKRSVALEPFFRSLARGRDEATPVRAHNTILATVGTFVAILIAIGLALYFGLR